jgi:hypothetical protein
MKQLHNGEVIIDTGSPIRGRGGAATSKAPRNPQKQNLKNNTFVDTTISNVLCTSPFKTNQPPHLPDDCYFTM